MDTIRNQDKCYAVTRNNASQGFPLKWPPAPLPLALEEGPVQLSLRVSDDFASSSKRLKSVKLCLYIRGFSELDEIEVKLNGRILEGPEEPLKPGMYLPNSEAVWVRYDLMEQLPRLGENDLGLTLLKRNPDLTPERVKLDWWGSTITSMALSDVELDVGYK